jgi:glycosyltransferase involved in cell wall biosynthesis
MRITFSIITLCKGGAQRMLAELVNHLVRKGHDVKIVMPTYGVVEYDVNAPILRIKNPVAQARDLPASDILVSNFYTTVPGVCEASQAGKGKHVRLSLCYEPSFLSDNHISFPTYHATSNLFVLSKWQQNIISLNHGIKSEIIPIGVSSQFKPLSIRGKGPIQISAIMRKPEGGYAWHREQDYLIQQLNAVKLANPTVKINLITPPNEFSTSRNLQLLQKANWLNFLTPHNDVVLNHHLNEADIFVNSSTYDSASLPSLEAMRTGAAVVTTYSGGNMDYCKNGVNCLMSYRYENKLAKDINRLIHNPALRKRLAEAGTQESLKWTWERSTQLFEKALLKLM